MLQRRELAWSRCLELLSSRGVGRVAVSSPDGPQIYPASYTVLEGAVWFRLPVHNAVANQIGARAVVALQVDQLDEESHAGWTVQVRGQAVAIDDPERLGKVSEAWYPPPWAVPGRRFVYLRLPLEEVSGREVSRPAWDENGASDGS